MPVVKLERETRGGPRWYPRVSSWISSPLRSIRNVFTDSPRWEGGGSNSDQRKDEEAVERRDVGGRSGEEAFSQGLDLNRESERRNKEMLGVNASEEQMVAPASPGEGPDSRTRDNIQWWSNQSQDGTRLRAMNVHPVYVPPPPSLFQELWSAVYSLLFSRDPVESLRGQKKRKKLWFAVQAIFPIVGWLPNYTLSEFWRDVIAGLTIASLAVPQDLGYAKLAGLPPVNGLYSSFVPPLIYPVLGSSKDIAIGPVAVVSILMGTRLRSYYKQGTPEYFTLAITSTLIAGIVQLGMGILRLGFIIDFLSHAAVVGFMAGAAITIALQQLKGFFGIKHFTTNTDIISVFKSVFSDVHNEWNWQTILISLFFLGFLLATRYVGKKYKRLFWIASLGPLVSVVLSTLFVFIVKANRSGVAIVGHIKSGVNPSSIKDINLNGKMLGEAFAVGVAAGLVALTEAIAIARTFAALRDYHIDGNNEMIAIGTMNIVGSLTSCYVTTGSFSRSAVNYNAGCRTAVTNWVMSLVVLLTLLVITPLFKYTPNCILSVIIITAVINLIDFKAAAHIWRVDKTDFIVTAGAFFGVLFVSVEIGLLIAVCISILKYVIAVTRPSLPVLGRIPDTNEFRAIQQYPQAERVQGVMVLRVDSTVYFGNANYIRESLMHAVQRERSRLKHLDNPFRLHCVILDLSGVMEVDTTAVQMFGQLLTAMKNKRVQLALANPLARVVEKLSLGGVIDSLGGEWVFLTVGEAMEYCSAKLEWANDDMSVRSLPPA